VARTPTAEDPSTHHIISPYPIYVDELQETERSGDVSAVFRSWEPSKNDWRTFPLDLGKVIGLHGRGALASKAVVVDDKRWKNFTGYVGAFVNVLKGTRKYGTRYDQFGWKTAGAAPAFVLGLDRFIAGQPSPSPALGSDEVDRRGRLMAVSGEVTSWTAAAQALIEPLTPAHKFMFMCSFAAPLYAFTGENGATFVHATTTNTGQGKTAMQNAGGTVWGLPDATSINSRDTTVAKFITLGTLNNLPVFFDELRFPLAEETKDYVLLGTLGRDKQRGKVDGGLRSDQLSWSTIHISASNLSLVDTVQHDGSETAQAARIFEFSLRLPDGLKTSDGDAIMAVLRENRGTAGRKFIQHVLDNYDYAKAAVLERMRHYEQRLSAGPESRFAIRLLACVDVGADLVGKCGVLDLDRAEIMDWACGEHGTASKKLAQDAAQDPGAIVSEMMNDLLPGTLIISGGGIPREPRSELVGRHDQTTGEYLFAIAAVRAWMQKKHYPMTETGKRLRQAGIVSDLRTRKTLGKGWKADGTVWCWSIDGRHPLLSEVAAQGDNIIKFRGAS
jgi:hypothetical protein